MTTIRKRPTAIATSSIVEPVVPNLHSNNSLMKAKVNANQTSHIGKIQQQDPLHIRSPPMVNDSSQRSTTVHKSLAITDKEHQLPPISTVKKKSSMLRRSTSVYSSETMNVLASSSVKTGLKNGKTLPNTSSSFKTLYDSSSKKQINVYNHDDFFQKAKDPSSVSNTQVAALTKNELNSTNNKSAREIKELQLNLADKQQLLRYIESNVIGKNLRINTPWGSRKVIYADYTASGRGLLFIENYIMSNVLPFYANTHSENSTCALQTAKFYEESRDIIKRCVNANNEDVVIFTGSGSTAAMNKLVNVLNLKDEIVRSKIVVFISTFEHHSNILPWKETGVEVIRIPNNKLGLLDEDFLRNQLKYYRDEHKKQIICTFSAASNVTGILTDVDKMSQLVHKYGGWIFWDYAAAAPYIKIDMNPSKTAYKEAVFISTHKFIGGPSSSGLLIAKRSLFKNDVPSNVGGGTVNFVTRTQIEYVKDIEKREEGGTPDILGVIRAGLVFHLKESVGYQIIEAREDELVSKFFTRFRKHPRLCILGSTSVRRLGIFSFLIYVPSFKKYLHHNFVCILLNDLFGIQVRSGCSCAGPYVLDLLNIDDETANLYTRFITENENARLENIQKNQLMKPGFTRFNLSYFISDEEVDYILNAIEIIANDGWKFLPLYTYDSDTATWYPRVLSRGSYSSQYHHLSKITYRSGIMEEDFAKQPLTESLDSTILHLITKSTSNDPIDIAKTLANYIPGYVYENIDFKADPPLNVVDEYKDLIWFVLPKDIIRKMIVDFEQNREKSCKTAPFRPKLDED